MNKILLEIDDLDYLSIQKAITTRQLNPRTKNGTMLPDGDGNLTGRIIADICRAFVDYRNKKDQ